VPVCGANDLCSPTSPRTTHFRIVPSLIRTQAVIAELDTPIHDVGALVDAVQGWLGCERINSLVFNGVDIACVTFLSVATLRMGALMHAARTKKREFAHR